MSLATYLPLVPKYLHQAVQVPEKHTHHVEPWHASPSYSITWDEVCTPRNSETKRKNAEVRTCKNGRCTSTLLAPKKIVICTHPRQTPTPNPHTQFTYSIYGYRCRHVYKLGIGIRYGYWALGVGVQRGICSDWVHMFSIRDSAFFFSCCPVLKFSTRFPAFCFSCCSVVVLDTKSSILLLVLFRSHVFDTMSCFLLLVLFCT